MSEDSAGWQSKGIKARHILKETVERIEPPIKLMLADALREDLRAIGFQ